MPVDRATGAIAVGFRPDLSMSVNGSNPAAYGTTEISIMQTVFQPDDRRAARAAAFRHHPDYETPRERDSRIFREEIARDLDCFRDMRIRLEAARIIESGWPC